MAEITFHGDATLSEIQAAIGQMHMVLADSAGNLHAYRIAISSPPTPGNPLLYVNGAM